MDKASEDQLNQLLANSGDWQENVPMVEDLTDEVQDLMLRYRKKKKKFPLNKKK
jgi:hypothetical protein